MMGRSTDVEGVAGNANLVYVGTAAGGVWKTTNGGTTWAPLFDKQPTLSIGDLALEPGNPDVIYAGTGEANVRNSVSFGRGMYKSTDGGRSWRFIGLGDTRHIARVMVNPADTRTVYTCAVGHMAGPNAERGVFVSRDGGTTWSKTLYVDDKHGCADLDVDPKNPNIVYAAMWLFDRKQWTFTSGSEQGGIYKSVDGGQTWRKLGGGLPKLLGRVGIKVAPSSPNTVYAITESKEGFVYRSDDFGETWRKTSDDSRTICRGFYYSDLRVDPQNPERVYSIACNLMVSIDGARTFRPIGQTVHGDHHGLWIDPAEPTRLWDVNDGGIAESRDHGATWRFPNVFPLAQFYQLHADNREPFYHLGGGLQDNGNWVGPSRTRDPLGILIDDWQLVSYGDGYYQTSHPDDPDFIITDSQGGMIWRTQMRTREQEDISPQPRRNDGAPVNALQYRFNWNAPYRRLAARRQGGLLRRAGPLPLQGLRRDLAGDLPRPLPERHHAARLGRRPGHARSDDRRVLQHDLLDRRIARAEGDHLGGGRRREPARDQGRRRHVDARRPQRPGGGPGGGGEPRGGEPHRALHRVRDVRAQVHGRPQGVRLPHHRLRRQLDEHCRQPPRRGVPAGAARGPEEPAGVVCRDGDGALRERDGGERLVPVRRQPPRGAGARGVGAWPRERPHRRHARARHLDSRRCVGHPGTGRRGGQAGAPLRDAHRHALCHQAGEGIAGQRAFHGAHPAYGAIIRYHLKERPAAATTVKAEILDGEGKVVRTLARVPREAGINTTAWDLSYEPARPRAAPSGPEGEGEAIMRRLFGAAGGPRALPGRYTVRLTVGDQVLEQPLTVRVDPTSKTTPEALRGQFIVAVELRDLLSLANDTLRALDGRRGELEAKRRAAVAHSQRRGGGSRSADRR
jgi:photosystem II stability/assembly factor-like uncharacterized protein